MIPTGAGTAFCAGGNVKDMKNKTGIAGGTPYQPFEMEEREIRGAATRVFRNAPPTLRELFVAGRAHGDRTFLVYDDERASFESFARAALAIAAELVAQGVRKGDRVAIAMRNLPEWPAIFFGASITGAQATVDALRGFVAERLAAFKVPVRVMFVNETFASSSVV